MTNSSCFNHAHFFQLCFEVIRFFNKIILISLSLIPQVAPPLDPARSAADPRPVGSRKHSRPGIHGPCSGLHDQCHRLLLHLRDGVRADPEHPLLRDLPHSSPRHLHRHLCHDVLDRRHHRHLLAPRHAQLVRPGRSLLPLRRRLRPRVGVRVPQSPRDQRDAARGHHGVLRGRGEAERGEREELRKERVGVWFLLFFVCSYRLTSSTGDGDLARKLEGEKLVVMVIVLRKLIDYQV